MSDSRTVGRFSLCPVPVHMNPLPIVGDLRKLANHLLCYGEPFRYGDLPADKLAQRLRRFND